jgi:hypothetical protein
MKITTKKIIRELEKKGYEFHELDNYTKWLITDVRNIIDEILTQHKNITIR